MKLEKLRSGIMLLVVAAALTTSSCKDKAKEKDTTTSATPGDTASASAIDTSTVVTDDALTTQLKDATKDYPGVTATVDNGEVTLTGTIKRDKLQDLLQAVHALNPAKVNNKLTIE